ncbi:unnamed protein product, partial [Rotaria magnacalcarata]
MVRFSFFDHNVGLTQDLSKQTTDLLWFQLEQDVILQIPGNKQEMIDACRLYYRGNPKVLKMIDHFKNEYRSDEAIQTYLKKSFLYKIVNKALRIKDFDELDKFRCFVKDLIENIACGHRKMSQSTKEPLFVYRGMKMNQDEIGKFKENEGNLVSIHGLLETTSIRSTALTQVIKVVRETHMIPVLLEIESDLNHNASFTDTIQCGDLPSEKDILFDSNVTFRLEKVKTDEKVVLMALKVSTDGETIKQKYIEDTHRQIENLSMKILFGRLMCDIGL